MNHIILNKEIYNVNLNPEIGSSMIFKIKKKTNQNDVNSNSDTINIKQQIPANNLDFKGSKIKFLFSKFTFNIYKK